MVDPAKMAKARDDGAGKHEESDWDFVGRPIQIDGSPDCQKEIVAELEKISRLISEVDFEVDTIGDEIDATVAVLKDEISRAEPKLAQWKVDQKLWMNPKFLELKEEQRLARMRQKRIKFYWEVLLRKDAAAARLFKREDILLQAQAKTDL